MYRRCLDGEMNSLNKNLGVVSSVGRAFQCCAFYHCGSRSTRFRIAEDVSTDPPPIPLCARLCDACGAKQTIQTVAGGAKLMNDATNDSNSPGPCPFTMHIQSATHRRTYKTTFPSKERPSALHESFLVCAPASPRPPRWPANGDTATTPLDAGRANSFAKMLGSMQPTVGGDWGCLMCRIRPNNEVFKRVLIMMTWLSLFRHACVLTYRKMGNLIRFEN